MSALLTAGVVELVGIGGGFFCSILLLLLLFELVSLSLNAFRLALFAIIIVVVVVLLEEVGLAVGCVESIVEPYIPN